MKFDWKTLASAPCDGTWVAVKCEGYTPDVASFDKATGKWKNVSNWEGEVYEH